MSIFGPESIEAAMDVIAEEFGACANVTAQRILAAAEAAMDREGLARRVYQALTAEYGGEWWYDVDAVITALFSEGEATDGTR